MVNSGNCIDNLAVGMEVEINPQKDRSRENRVLGIIAEILTKSSQHPHGILVSLETGETGRVKKIISKPTGRETQGKTPIRDVQRVDDNIDFESLITNGENHFVEYKSSILWSVKFSDQQVQDSNTKEVKKYRRDASKFIIAKTIAGFLNSDGGNLVIGIKENKTVKKDEIVGIESEFNKLQDQCTDGYRRMIVDQIIKEFFPSSIFHHINNYLHINFEKFEKKMVCHIKVLKSDSQVFITHKKEEYFFVRIDASTREIHGEEIVDYCLKRFSRI